MRVCDPGDSETRARLQISVIVCTRNRADSLKITLEHLAAADQSGIRTEVVVVDNGSSDETREVALSFDGRLAVRYLFEPTLGTYGKSHALNRALKVGCLGEIIAVLDDDMTVQADWFQGVVAICNRWPDKDIFTGDTYVIWPSENVPLWVRRPAFLGGLLSCYRVTSGSIPLMSGQWFSGNHFWFRSRVVERGFLFKDIWLTEPDFQLNLVEAGFSGIASPEAAAGHRVQRCLMEWRFAQKRVKSNEQAAWIRLRPFRRSVRQARRFQVHPWLARLFYVGRYLYWGAFYCLSMLVLSEDRRFEVRYIALEGMSLTLGYLRAAHGCTEYSLRPRLLNKLLRA